MNAPSSSPGPDSFRDRLGIVTIEGKRRRVYPKAPQGRFHNFRALFSIVLLGVLFGVPFLRLHGQPFMLFDITERKFIIAGLIFGPHDFVILALGMITVIVSIFLFTVVFGRLFCGWACPQTVLLEMVFRKIDYWIEGSPAEQSRLNASPWNGRKVRVKGIKHAMYFALSFLIANTLLAWIIGTEKLFRIMTEPVGEHLAGFTAIMFFSIGFHWLFSWFREYACILVCPYGRLQGVMLDRNSIVIAYDHVRGEPRARFKKSEVRKAGDCIECGQCVDVCPTGIDIRNGTQLECVNCTACIDACDAIMEGIGKPRGLIRYDSIQGIETQVRRIWSSRAIGYLGVLAVLVTILGFKIAGRADVDVTILRTPGLFYQEQPDDYVSNLYDIKAVNKTFRAGALSFKLRGAEGKISVLGDSLTLDVQETAAAKMFVMLKRDRIRQMNTPIEIEVYQNGMLVNTAVSSFMGPVKNK